MNNFQLPSPIQELSSPFLRESRLKLFVKRDDLIHPEVSGNKWRKLKYNVEVAQKKGMETILTFGGAHSNHLLATAVVGKIYALKTIAVVRGERPKELSDTLSDCEQYGMQLHFISRAAYREKDEDAFIRQLRTEHGPFYLIPEGGANIHGVEGCKEILSEIDIDYDFIACSAGTGTTAAGVLQGMDRGKLLVFPALKGIDFWKQEIFGPIGSSKPEQAEFFKEYHFGGYAKWNDALVDFVQNFYRDYQIQLDLVYTGKLFYGLLDQIRKGYFPEGTKIVLLHTGGLQGNRGMEKRLGYKLF